MAVACCAVGAAFTQDIKAGMVVDQSSLNADISRDYLAGARTWFDHIKAQAGIAGRKIALLVRDDGGDPTVTISMTRQLIDTDKVDVLFGYASEDGSTAVAGDRSFRSTRIALYAPLNGMGDSTTTSNVFCLRPSYREEAKYVLNHFGQLGLRRFAVVHTPNQHGQLLTRQIEQEMGAQEFSPVATLALSGDKRWDLGGVTLNFSPGGERGSRFVEIAFLRRSGRLLQK